MLKFENDKILVFIFGPYPLKNKDQGWHTAMFGEESDTIVADGGRLRVLAAYELYKQDDEVLLVPSASKGQLSHIEDMPTIAELMRQELLALGVSDSNIQKDEKAGNTLDELLELVELVSSKKPKKLILLSNMYHLPRIKAFIEHFEELQPLKKLGTAGILELRSAEDILIKADPDKWEQLIREGYESEGIKEMIALEERGVKAIKEGTYGK